MAPKKGDAKATKSSEKTRAEAKKKVAEDKTFGLKNKNKSKVVQNHIKQAYAGLGPNFSKDKDAQDKQRKAKKEQEEKTKRELDALFQEAIKQPKVPQGVDPKSIMCEFYKKGQCTKGFKCKFSHNEAVERKGAKMDIYSDSRDAGEDDEGMEEWDQETLEKAVQQKHGNEKPNQTKIICKFFIEAIEKKQYGWFWVCPNGGKGCQYRHALPQGYVLKSQMKQLLEEEIANKKSVEEEIEEQRQKVEARTPLTEQVFREWREKKMAEHRLKEEKEREERIKSQRFTGREIFALEGFVAVDDNSASDSYERDNDDEEAIRKSEEQALEALTIARMEESGIVGTQGCNPICPIEGCSDNAETSNLSMVLQNLQLSKDDEELFMDDDGDLDVAELDAIEENLRVGVS